MVSRSVLGITHGRSPRLHFRRRAHRAGLIAFCCGNSVQNSLLSNLYSRSCAMEDTVTILAGAERIIRGRRRQVNRKWPRWFTPNWVSKPSSVFLWGQARIPETFAPHDSILDNLCHFRLGTHFPWLVYGVVSALYSLRRPSVRMWFFFVCKWFWCSSFLNTHAVMSAKPRINEFSFQCIYYVDGSQCLHVGNSITQALSRHTTHAYKIFRT